MQEIINDATEGMQKSITSLEREFAKLRTGRANTALVDNIKVDYYGTMTPISQMASVTIPDASSIAIQPWDRSAMGLIEKAIQNSDLGLSPNNDGTNIRINIPPLTEERRKEIAKLAKKYTEEAKVGIRNVRRDANEAFKKLEKDKEISEDDARRGTDEVQKLTDSYVKKADDVYAKKESEIMAI